MRFVENPTVLRPLKEKFTPDVYIFEREEGKRVVNLNSGSNRQEFKLDFFFFEGSSSERVEMGKNLVNHQKQRERDESLLAGGKIAYIYI